MRRRILIIDDDTVVDPPEGAIQARTSKEAIEQLSTSPWWDVVYFDHDLGPNDDAMKVVEWLEQQREDVRGPRIEQALVHSMNPAGADRLYAALRSLCPTRRIPLPFERRP